MAKVAIVGGGPSSEMLAPFDDREWKIWVLGNRSNKYPRMDRIFEIHEDRTEHKQPEYDQYLLEKGIPLVVGENFPAGENVSRFPYDDAARLLGGLYLTSSPAYMMALAILEGVRHIGLWGCDMAVDDHEYFYQRPCLEAWVGYAKGLGITITIPHESPLFRNHYVEGKDHGKGRTSGPFTQGQFMVLAEQHAQRIADIRLQVGQLDAEIHAHDGARQAYERLAKVARAIEAKQDIQTLTETVRIK